MSPSSPLSLWEKIVGFIFGFVFVTALLILAVFIPEPSATQFSIFKTILSLAAAGVAGILAGFVQVHGRHKQWSVKAGGALVVFLIVYFFTPLAPESFDDQLGIKQTIESGGTGAIHTGDGDIHINGKK